MKFRDIEKPKEWKLLDKRIVVKNRFVSLYECDFLTGEGVVVRDYYVLRRNDVVVLVLVNEGQIFVVKEFERGVGKVGDKFISGYVEEGEEPIEAAKRELQEEMGLSGRFKFLGETYVNPGTSTQKMYVFLVTNLKKVGNKDDNPLERFNGGWVDLREFEKLIASGEIHNQFVLSAYCLVRERLV